MKTSESIIKITAALIKAQANIKHADKDAKGNHNTYATLESVIDAVKKPLLDVGITIIQFPDSNSLTTRLQHESGEFIENTLDLILTKQDMQGLGSGITYARRYSLTSMLNIAQTDDDGAMASQKGKTPKVVSKTPSTSPLPKKAEHDF